MLHAHLCRPSLRPHRHQLLPIDIYRNSKNGRNAASDGFGSNFIGTAFCLPHQLVGILFGYTYDRPMTRHAKRFCRSTKQILLERLLGLSQNAPGIIASSWAFRFVELPIVSFLLSNRYFINHNEALLSKR